MESQSDFQVCFDFLKSKPIVVEPSAARVSSDAGLLPFRQLDERIGLTRRFAEVLTDRRDQGRIDHSFLEMARMRVYGKVALLTGLQVARVRLQDINAGFQV